MAFQLFSAYKEALKLDGVTIAIVFAELALPEANRHGP